MLTDLQQQDRQKVVTALNVLVRFLAVRDVLVLTNRLELKQILKTDDQLDVLILFGGSILEGARTFHDAILAKAARHFMIVGGYGHTTYFLNQQMKKHGFDFAEATSEAEMFQGYLLEKYGDRVNLVETESTNCGNNITYALNLLDQQRIEPHSIGFIQEGSMQRRMDAGFRKFAPGVTLVNYAAEQVKFILRAGQIGYKQNVDGMWSLDSCLSLIMGEIPRLCDNSQGYGPN